MERWNEKKKENKKNKIKIRKRMEEGGRKRNKEVGRRQRRVGKNGKKAEWMERRLGG